jgi:hypothetical protein
MTGYLRASQAKVRVRRAVLGIFHRNRAAMNLNLRNLVLRPQQRAWVQMSRRALSIGRRRDFASLVVRRRTQVVLLVKRAVREKKRAVREKEGRVFVVNLAARHRMQLVLPRKRAVRGEDSRAFMVNLVVHHRVEHLLEPSTPRASLRADRNGPKEERHHRDHNKFWCSFTAAPERRLRGRFFFFCRFVGKPLASPGRQGRPYNNSAICTAFSAAPLSN